MPLVGLLVGDAEQLLDRASVGPGDRRRCSSRSVLIGGTAQWAAGLAVRAGEEGAEGRRTG